MPFRTVSTTDFHQGSLSIHSLLILRETSRRLYIENIVLAFFIVSSFGTVILS